MPDSISSHRRRPADAARALFRSSEGRRETGRETGHAMGRERGRAMGRERGRARRRESGHALLIVVVMVMVMIVSSTVAMRVWNTVMKREKEEELIFRGK